MAYSFNTYTSNGVTRNYSFNFTGPAPGYLRRSDIRVYTKESEEGGWVETKDFTLLGANYLELGLVPPAVGFDNIKIARVMPKGEPLGSWNTGSFITPENLQQAFLQQLYVGHEVLDGVYVLERDFEIFKSEMLSLYQEFTTTIDNRVTEFEEGVSGSLSEFEQDYLLHKQEVDASLLELSNLLDVKMAEIDEAISSMEEHKIQERAERQAADQNLQSQITGGVPALEASAFSPISWHKQSIENSVAIPPDVNAWSFGPFMRIADGQEVTVGAGSHWIVSGGQEGLPGSGDTPIPAYVSRSISANVLPLSVSASPDPELQAAGGYQQVVGIFSPIPDGVVRNGTQQTDSFTVGISGVYRIEFWANAKTTVNNNLMAFKFSINGVLSATRRPVLYMRNQQETHNAGAFSNIRLNAGDVLSLYIASDKTANITITDCVFGVTKIDD